MSEKLSEFSEMSDVAQASVLIRDVVPVDAGATVLERIGKTARRLGWPYSRTKDVWYEDARRIDAAEMDQLRAARRAREAEATNAEIKDLRARLARLEMVLSPDEEFHRPHLEGLREHLRLRSGMVDGSRDGGGE